MLKSIQWLKSYIFGLFRGHTASKSQKWSTLISPLDWPWKTTPNWLLTSWNAPTSSQVTVISSSCQLICTAIMLIWPHHSLGLQKLPLIDSPHAEIPSFIEFWWPVNFTKPYQTKPNELKFCSNIKCLLVSSNQLWFFYLSSNLMRFLSF